jgi:hypothetical protein
MPNNLAITQFSNIIMPIVYYMASNTFTEAITVSQRGVALLDCPRT